MDSADGNTSALPATGERPAQQTNNQTAPDTIDTAVAIGAIGTTSAGRPASSGALHGGVNAYIYSKGASAASIIILMKSSSPTPSSTKTNISWSNPFQSKSDRQSVKDWHCHEGTHRLPSLFVLYVQPNDCSNRNKVCCLHFGKSFVRWPFESTPTHITPPKERGCAINVCQKQRKHKKKTSTFHGNGRAWRAWVRVQRDGNGTPRDES